MPVNLFREAERLGRTLSRLSLFGESGLLFGDNGTLFRIADEHTMYDVVCLRDGFSQPTGVFYADPYLEET